MKQHEYQITVKHIADAKGNPSTYDDDLIFTAYNHDDIFKILEYLKQKELTDENSMKSFAVGLKLMSGSLAGFNLFINGQLLDGFISKWFVSWILSWLVAFPLILIFIPLVRRFLMLMVKFPKEPTK